MCLVCQKTLNASISIKKDPLCSCHEIANKLSRPKQFLLSTANMFFSALESCRGILT